MGWMSYIRMLLKGKPVVEEAVKQGKLLKDVQSKSSFRSSEFWISALGSLAAVAGQAAGVIPPPYGAIVAAASGVFYQVSRGLAKSGDPDGGVKPGMATTEFWANAMVNLGSVLAATQGAVTPDVAVVLSAVSNGAYAVSRGLAKGGAQPEPAQEPAK